MIPVNFSTTRIVADLISTHRESDHFIQREIVTRIIGISLSLFSLFDLMAHSIGALERVIVRDTASATKHLKCMQLFLEAIPLASFQALYKPDPKTFAFCENKRAALASALLLSGNSETLKKISASDFLDYVLSLREEMPEQESMEKVLSMLPGAKDLYKDFDRLKGQKLLIEGGLTLKLSNSIKKLLDNNPSLLKECFARLLSLGLSFSAALDFLGRLVVKSLYLLGTFLLDILVLRGQLYNRDFKLMGLLFLDHLKDIFFTLPGIVGGSITGVVDPQLAIKIATSGFYEKFRYTYHNLSEKINQQIQNLNEGKLMIPLTFHSTTSKTHYIYLTLDKRFGRIHFQFVDDPAEIKNLGVFDKSLYLIEPDVRKITQLVTDLIHQSTRSPLEEEDPWDWFLKIMHSVFFNHTLSPHPGLKATTTCPKDSLLGLLELYSLAGNSTFLSYAIFNQNLKNLARERDGHLLDIALSIPKT